MEMCTPICTQNRLNFLQGVTPQRTWTIDYMDSFDFYNFNSGKSFTILRQECSNKRWRYWQWAIAISLSHHVWRNWLSTDFLNWKFFSVLSILHFVQDSSQNVQKWFFMCYSIWKYSYSIRMYSVLWCWILYGLKSWKPKYSTGVSLDY